MSQSVATACVMGWQGGADREARLFGQPGTASMLSALVISTHGPLDLDPRTSHQKQTSAELAAVSGWLCLLARAHCCGLQEPSSNQKAFVIVDV